MIVAPVSVFIFILFCILKMAIGTEGANVAAKISAFTILPFVSGIFGIAAFVIHFSPFEKFARENNGVATSIAMATYAYFAEQPELLADDAKIVYVSFGAENVGHCGSRAFVEAHPEFASAKVLAIGDILSGNFQVAECDAIRNIDFSLDVVSSVHASAIERASPCPQCPTIRLRTSSIRCTVSSRMRLPKTAIPPQLLCQRIMRIMKNHSPKPIWKICFRFVWVRQ